MIYFFHHYELPSILNQERIHRIIAQAQHTPNQQVHGAGGVQAPQDMGNAQAEAPAQNTGSSSTVSANSENDTTLDSGDSSAISPEGPDDRTSATPSTSTEAAGGTTDAEPLIIASKPNTNVNSAPTTDVEPSVIASKPNTNVNAAPENPNANSTVPITNTTPSVNSVSTGASVSSVSTIETISSLSTNVSPGSASANTMCSSPVGLHSNLVLPQHVSPATSDDQTDSGGGGKKIQQVPRVTALSSQIQESSGDSDNNRCKSLPDVNNSTAGILAPRICGSDSTNRSNVVTDLKLASGCTALSTCGGGTSLDNTNSLTKNSGNETPLAKQTGSMSRDDFNFTQKSSDTEKKVDTNQDRNK